MAELATPEDLRWVAKTNRWSANPAEWERADRLEALAGRLPLIDAVLDAAVAYTRTTDVLDHSADALFDAVSAYEDADGPSD